jgi:hypothetical protein
MANEITDFDSFFKSLAAPSNDLPEGFDTPSSAPTLATQKKVDALQTKWGKQGFKFELDEKGQMVISNTPETRQAQAPTITAPTEDQRLVGKNLQAQINAIQTEASPEARQQLYQNLQVSAASEKARYWNEAMAQAGVKLQVPQLEAALAQNEALDRQDPRWAEFQSDSPITAKLRTQLQAARSQVDNEAKNMLAGNVGLAALTTQLAAMSKLMERKERLGEQLDIWKEQKEFTKELQAEAEKERLLETVSPEMIARASILDPSLNGKPAEVIARHIVKGVKDNAMKAVLAAPDEALSLLTFGEDNKHAAKVLMKKEEERTGRTSADVADQMKAIGRTMTDEKQLRKDLSIVYRGDKKAQEEYLAAVTRAKVGGTKADKEAAHGARVQVALAVQARMAEARFTKDLRQWRGYADPMMQPAIEKSMINTGKADLENVLAAYIGDATGQERRVLVDSFIAAMKVSGDAGPSKSLIAPVDTQQIATVIQRLAVEKSLAGQLGSDFNKWLTGSLDERGLKSRMIPAPYNVPIEGATDAISDFFGVKNNGE